VYGTTNFCCLHVLGQPSQKGKLSPEQISRCQENWQKIPGLDHQTSVEA